jgi:hypothetical protein
MRPRPRGPRDRARWQPKWLVRGSRATVPLPGLPCRGPRGSAVAATASRLPRPCRPRADSDFPERTIVTYDPRGAGRSPRADGVTGVTPDEHAQALARSRACAWAQSGGRRKGRPCRDRAFQSQSCLADGRGTAADRQRHRLWAPAPLRRPRVRASWRPGAARPSQGVPSIAALRAFRSGAPKTSRLRVAM